MDLFKELIFNRLSFLCESYGFSNPRAWQITYESHVDYRKGRFSLDVHYEYGEFVDIAIYRYKTNNSNESNGWYFMSEKLKNAICSHQPAALELPEPILSHLESVEEREKLLPQLRMFDNHLNRHIEFLNQNEALLSGRLRPFSAFNIWVAKMKGTIGPWYNKGTVDKVK
ncbi:MAG: hypothetical protein HQ556_08290 [Candidatus Marinimicrobia bacterium]|nr:hypothetical protein [Candidatus Neomarinimicrobiota bacterium]